MVEFLIIYNKITLNINLLSTLYVPRPGLHNLQILFYSF